MRILPFFLAAWCSGCVCGTVTIGGTQPDGGRGADGGGADAGNLGPDGGPCLSGCSDDLLQVVDCRGNATACPQGQGCGGGVCMDPCLAAVANGSTVGCDFYASAVAAQPDTVGSCYTVLVANTWNTPVGLSLSYGAQTFSTAQVARVPSGSGVSLQYGALPINDAGVSQLPPGQMAILFLGASPTAVTYFVDCPAGASPAVTSSFQLDGTGLGQAFHITTTAPVVAYDMYPWGGAQSYVSSASLLIPTSAWGTNYVGVDPHETNTGYPYLQIYGSVDGTQLALQAPVAIVGGGGVAATPAGTVGRYTLNKGQVLQLEQSEELSGTLIKSDQPIAVFGGHSCMQVPTGQVACDSSHQQFPAVPLLGSSYAVARYADRVGGGVVNEVTWFRLVGAVDGTTLTYDPPQPGAPLTLNASQNADFTSTGPFTVKSQDDAHIFAAGVLMTGGDHFNGYGDPEFVNVVPALQFLRKYLFLTDPTYATTDLTFVRGLGGDGLYHDVTLDCLAAPLTGWVAVGGSGYQVTHVLWGMAGANGCGNGVHTATSAAPFGLTVWGYDQYASYAYPAGMGVKAINTVVVGPTIN